MTLATWLLNNEGAVRLGAFLSLFGALLLAQWLRPRRVIMTGFGRRLTNVTLVVIDTIVVRLLFPLLAFDMAIKLAAQDRGLLAGLDGAVGIVVGVLLLDLAIYWQHRLLHVVPFLWRLHRMHHADVEFDVTTAVRFHPLEIAASMIIKLGLIAVLGVAPLAVLVFEVLLNATSLFTHTNVRLPVRLDHALRWLVVTPDMHRIHHSVHADEMNSNFSFSLSLWDRLFASYRREPRDGHVAMQIGLDRFRAREDQTLLQLLLNPLRPDKLRDETTQN